MDYMAFYFPQFHTIPENDQWWGVGFTDWELVKKAKPIMSGQQQPRMPLNGEYYDLSSAEEVDSQIVLAQKYGLSGFNFYHYWFDGKVLLDAPLKHFRANQSHDLNYCITWANESWTRQWIGDPTVLIRQNYAADRKVWQAHFDYLKGYFEDPRYLCRDEKPVLCIYRPELIPHLKEYLAYLNSLAEQAGFKGIYFIRFDAYPVVDQDTIFSGFDAAIKFQPRQFFNSKNKMKRLEGLLRRLPETLQLPLAKLKYAISKRDAYSYDDLWQSIITQAKEEDKTVYQSALVDWDNTARYGEKAKLFTGASPQQFFYWLDKLSEIEVKKGQSIIFINAWNEWSECAYLEPDILHQYGYLEAVAELVAKYGN